MGPAELCIRPGATFKDKEGSTSYSIICVATHPTTEHVYVVATSKYGNIVIRLEEFYRSFKEISPTCLPIP